MKTLLPDCDLNIMKPRSAGDWIFALPKKTEKTKDYAAELIEKITSVLKSKTCSIYSNVKQKNTMI